MWPGKKRSPTICLAAFASFRQHFQPAKIQFDNYQFALFRSNRINNLKSNYIISNYRSERSCYLDMLCYVGLDIFSIEKTK
jgi:hypothetical protein